ncbi:MAG: DUF1003 domain-containing protein [Actinomycetaceae bacterium]|nr:DUF1003 domain-containing protein [Actinomycetaceae bacterium]
MNERLDTPSRAGSRLGRLIHRDRRRSPGGDSEAFGRAAEAIARFFGTPKFLFWMTIFVAAWIIANVVLARTQGLSPFDPYPFILLNLAFSTQASYSAPLLLLAQNRQDNRDRVLAEQDRRHAEQSRADTEYLTREIAALRIAMSEMATRDFVKSELRTALEELLEKLSEDEATPTKSDFHGGDSYD